MAEHLNNNIGDARRWDMAFLSGWDFFGDLPYRSAAEMRERMEAAWHRLGATFLAYLYSPTPNHPTPETTYAWQQFGPPPGWRNSILETLGTARLGATKRTRGDGAPAAKPEVLQ